MAGTADFKLLPADYNKVTSAGYIRKIKLKKESYEMIVNKAKIGTKKFSNSVSTVGNDEFVPNVENRNDLVARLDEKINVILPDYSRVESVKNRAIKIKTEWKANCLINAGLLIKPEEKEPVEIPEEEVIENAEKTLPEVAIENIENNELDNVANEIIETPNTDEINENEIVTEEVEQPTPEIGVDEIQEEQQELISKNSERNIEQKVYELVEEEKGSIIKFEGFRKPVLPRLNLKSLMHNAEDGEEIVSSDYRLDSNIELDISDKLNATKTENRDMPVDYDAKDKGIDEIKAELESIKQKKAEQERANQAKQQAEEARREEEARLEEIKKRNLEAVEKLRVQREAISERIEENIKKEEEERQKAEEIRKQIELQEELLGEIENEISDI